MTRVTIRDPIDGSGFTTDDTSAPLYVELAKRHGMPIWDIYKMVRVVLLGIEARDDEWYPERELDQLKRDNYDLDHWKGVLSVEALLAIHNRAWRAIARRAERETDPIKKQELEAMLKITPEWERILRRAEAMLAKRGDHAKK
jgi:hypothetical protein